MPWFVIAVLTLLLIFGFVLAGRIPRNRPSVLSQVVGSDLVSIHTIAASRFLA
jgi:hypothetical protein